MKTISSWAELGFDEHIFFNCVDEINYLIKPITKYFELDSFNYHKTFLDNSQIRLTNKPEWYKYYLSNKLYQHSVFELPAKYYSKGRIIWSNINTHSVILQAASEFGIKYGITLIEPVADGCEFYFLGSTSDDSNVIDKYLSNFQLLDKFIESFSEMRKSLFSKIIQHRTFAKDWFDNKLQFKYIDDIDRLKFITELYKLRFTEREISCVPLLLKGYTAKQIAENLQLSFRTIEDYINNLKQKTNTQTKNELLTYLHDKFAI